MKISRELGPDYDDAIAASLAERLDHTIDARISEQLSARQMPPAAPHPMPGNDNALRLTMGIISLGVAIPLSAIGASFAGGPGLVLAWIGVLALFVLVVGGRKR